MAKVNCYFWPPSKIRMKHFLVVLAFSFISFFSIGQSAIVKGFVYEKETGNPIIFTNVYLENTSYGGVTDVNGYFAINRIPAGTYNLMVTFLGYDTLRETITLKNGEMMTKQLYLQKSSIELDEFEVSSEKQEAQTEVKMSVVKITPKELKQLPSVGGEADLAQYLQVLPGVIFTGDQGGQLYIRGGSPIQNKVLLDGMIIYNPFHSIGLFSVFETDIIRNADIYTGGFNAEYGGRISSIMDITTRDGNAKSFSGKIGMSTFGAKALLEGPLKKPKELGDPYISYILSGKTSYLDRTSKQLYQYVDTAGLPFNFNDLYGKITFSGDNGSKFNLFGFNYNDNVNYRGIAEIGWQNYGAGANFVLVPLYSPVLVEGNFSYSNYEITQQSTTINPRSSSIDGFNLGLNFTYFILDDEIKYGIDVVGLSTDFSFFNSLNRRIEQQQNTTELAGYLKYKWNRGKMVLEPSFRAQYYASLGTFSPEPRLGFKYNISDDLRFKLAGGLYSQNLISANSDRDVVNLFYGFLTGPDNLQNTFTDENGNVKEVEHKLQKSQHLMGGFEFDLNRRITFNLEGYYKRFSQLTNLNRNKIFDDTEDNFNRPEIQRKDFIIETGNAYGVDFVAKYDYKRIYFWAVYSLGFNDRWDGIQTYRPIFDRRHNVNLVSSYTFGKNLNWEINGRWNFGSGFPFTQNQGYYELFNFSDGIGTDYVTANGDLGISYAQLNQGRLPYYHRFDANLKYKTYYGENGELEVNVGVTNLYNRENIFYYDRISNERVNQLPILPSLGVSLRF